MGIMTWRDLPVLTGGEWPGLRYFCTLRMPLGCPIARDTQPSTPGASRAPYDTFNLGAHVGDDPTAVQANRARLAATLPAAPLWLDQVHGTQVLDADELALVGTSKRHRATFSESVEGAAPVADAVLSSTPGRVLAIMTADCLPVLLADDRAGVVGLAHAGWRGLAAGVLENTLLALRRRAPASSRWRAWIGPAIGQAAFEVGEEVRKAFVDNDATTASYFVPGRAHRWHADLAGLAAYRLAKLGVNLVEASGLCTYARPDLFYSYRRDGSTGRMATLAWLE